MILIIILEKDQIDDIIKVVRNSKKDFMNTFL